MHAAGSHPLMTHAGSLRRVWAAAAVVLALLAAGCGGNGQTKSARKPPIPALDIRPGSALVPVGRTLRFKAYLVQGAAATLIDPSVVHWSVTRDQGAPGSVRDGVFLAPDEINDSRCVVRAVYRSRQYTGSSSDVAQIRVVSGFSQGQDATGTAQEEELLEGPSVVGERIFDSSNPSAVLSGPPVPAVFSLGRSRRIVYLVTYHYNGGAGALPGTVEIVGGGRRYGPWRARGRPSAKGWPNVYWIVYPDVSLPAGDYTIRDSSPDTWSYNAVSGGRGMSIVEAAVDARQP